MTLSGRLRDQAARVDLYEHAETMREAADRIEVLKAALRAFGEHKQGCPVATGFDPYTSATASGKLECRCGFNAALSA